MPESPSKPAAAAQPVRLEREGAVARITLDRPPLNVLDLDALVALRGVLDDVAADTGVKVVVLAGAGRAFCAGVEVADHTAERVGRVLPVFHDAVRRIAALPVPVLAAVQGAALGGGCELLLVCDLVLARDDARLGQPEIKLGVFPPVAVAALETVVGRRAAADLILSGRTIDAAEAHAIGLVSQVLDGDGFEAAVTSRARDLASLSGPVLRLTKRALRESVGLPFDAALQRAESTYLEELMALEDASEGIAAFLEKRAPVWRER